MKKLTKKEEYLIAGIIGGVLVLGLYLGFVFIPLLRKMIDLTGKEKTISMQLKKASSVTSDMEKLYKEVAEISKKIEFFEAQLPKEVDFPQILNEIINLGKTNDIIFISIEPQPVKKIIIDKESKHGYLEIPVKLRIKSGYHELAKFINEIENNQRFMKVSNLEIKGDDREPLAHSVSLSVSAFALGTSETEAANSNR